MKARNVIAALSGAVLSIFVGVTSGSATTMQLAPNLNALAAGDDYVAYTPHVAGSFTDTYIFQTSGPIGGSVGQVVKLELLNPIFSMLKYDWQYSSTLQSGGGSLLSGFQTVSGTVSNFVAPIAQLGYYYLVITGTALVDGLYSAEIASPNGATPPSVPLPSAVVLFGSVLVGLGLVGRRRKRKFA